MTQNRIPFYFTVDFEDFYYDTLRHLNMVNPPYKKEALIKSYERIKYICNKYLENKKMSDKFYLKSLMNLLKNFRK